MRDKLPRASSLPGEPMTKVRIPSAVADRFAEPFEHDDTAAFTAHVAIGRGIECFAAPVGRHDAELREVDHPFRREDQIDPADERQSAFAVAQALTGEMYCRQR